MNLKIALLLLTTAAIALNDSPLLLLSAQHHQPVFNSDQLISYLKDQPKVKAIDLTLNLDQDLNTLKKLIESLKITKERISSFFSSASKTHKIKQFITKHHKTVFETQTLDQLRQTLQSNQEDIVLNIHTPYINQRILQQSVQSSSTATPSKIFNNLTKYSLSGLWVGLFLLIMLGISLSCLFNLKTNDKFARQNLWVGRQS